MRVRTFYSLSALLLAASANAQSLSQRADSAMKAAERDGFSGVGGGDGGTPLKPNGKPPAAGVAAVINGFIAALNSGNEKTLLAFITKHFDNSPSSPKPEERVGRIGGVHGNLGNMPVTGMYGPGDGPIRVTIKTEKQGPGTLIVDIDRGEAYKIKRLGVQIGN